MTFFGRAPRVEAKAVTVQFTVPETFDVSLEPPTGHAEDRPSDPLFTRVLVPAEGSRPGAGAGPCRMIAV